jgi:hypothetical protein
LQGAHQGTVLPGLPRRGTEHFDAVLPGQGDNLVRIRPPLPDQFIHFHEKRLEPRRGDDDLNLAGTGAEALERVRDAARPEGKRSGAREVATLRASVPTMTDASNRLPVNPGLAGPVWTPDSFPYAREPRGRSGSYLPQDIGKQGFAQRDVRFSLPHQWGGMSKG